MIHPKSGKRMLRLVSAIVIGGLLSACAPFGGSTDAEAKDQIMLVRMEPPSFGFKRLANQSRRYPDLGSFVALRGLPDFLAETSNENLHYLILYYLKDREAFACRSGQGRSPSLEFAGPYPITDREFNLLDKFRRDPTREPTEW